MQSQRSSLITQEKQTPVIDLKKCVSVDGNRNSVPIAQATKSITRQNKRNNRFFRITQEHDHSVIGGAGDARQKCHGIEQEKSQEEWGWDCLQR